MLGRKKKKESGQFGYTETVERVFAERRNVNARMAFEKRVPFLFRSGCLVGIVCLLVMYFSTPSGRVQGISVSGNYYLDSDYVCTVAGIRKKDVLYLDLPFVLSWRLQKDPMISSARVTWEDNGVIAIQVEENRPVGYRYEDSAMLLFADGSKTEIGSDYIDMISEVPYITGFTDKEQTRLLCKALGKLDRNVLSSISEIHQYSLGYEDEAMKILMKTGGYYIGTYQNVDKLKYYSDIYAAQADHSYCITGFDSGNTAFSTVCPWNETKDNVEYWTDDSGNILKNSYGDKVVKHYYVDSNGNKALDGAGNPIPIPIDSSHNEVIDKDFISHYEAGYYSTGTLVVP